MTIRTFVDFEQFFDDLKTECRRLVETAMTVMGKGGEPVLEKPFYQVFQVEFQVEDVSVCLVQEGVGFIPIYSQAENEEWYPSENLREMVEIWWNRYRLFTGGYYDSEKKFRVPKVLIIDVDEYGPVEFTDVAVDWSESELLGGLPILRSSNPSAVQVVPFIDDFKPVFNVEPPKVVQPPRFDVPSRFNLSGRKDDD